MHVVALSVAGVALVLLILHQIFSWRGGSDYAVDVPSMDSGDRMVLIQVLALLTMVAVVASVGLCALEM